jgi:hypothetical protein
MTVNTSLLLDLISNDKGMSILKTVWQNYADENGIEYADLADLYEKLPAKNIFVSEDIDFLYESVEVVTNWKKPIKNIYRSIVAEEIRSYTRNPLPDGETRDMRSLWYDFKPVLEGLCIKAFKNGVYNRDPETEPEWYEYMPVELSRAIQYFTTNQLNKDTEWIGNMSTVKRGAVCTYSDIGTEDISRNRKSVQRKINFKYVFEFLEKFTDTQDYINKTEEKNNVMITLYEDLDTIREMVKAEIDNEDNKDNLHVVVMVEKDTAYKVVEAFGEYMGVSVFSAHGQNSLNSLEDLMFRDLGIERGSNVIFLSLTDLDPAGLRIARAPAEQQFLKIGLKTVAWIHSEWHKTIDFEIRSKKKFLVKLNKKKGILSPFCENWVNKFGYDNKTDTFGTGGVNGFELNVLSNKQLRTHFKSLCDSIGITAENMLETLKDENREDIDECTREVALKWIDDNTNISTIFSELDSLKDEVTAPIDVVSEKFDDIKEAIIQAIHDELETRANEMTSEDDFDDRDVSIYVSDFVDQLLTGKTYWSNWSASVKSNSSLNKKLTKLLKDEMDELITIEKESFSTEIVDPDDIIDDIRDRIKEHEFTETEI